MCNGESARGFWNETEISKHINTLEILAIFYGLKCFAKDLKNCKILLRVDNKTAVAYINKMGGTKFPHLNAITKNIWQWCEGRNILIYASYIKSTDNKQADEESRHKKIETEYSLNQNVYLEIVNVLGKPSIDLFASDKIQNVKTTSLGTEIRTLRP